MTRGLVLAATSAAVLVFSAAAWAGPPSETPPACAGDGSCGTELGEGSGKPENPGTQGGADALEHDGEHGATVEKEPGERATVTLPENASDRANERVSAGGPGGNPAVQAHVAALHTLLDELHDAEGGEARAAIARELRVAIHELLFGLTGVTPNEQALFAVLGQTPEDEV